MQHTVGPHDPCHNDGKPLASLAKKTGHEDRWLQRNARTWDDSLLNKCTVTAASSEVRSLQTGINHLVTRYGDTEVVGPIVDQRFTQVGDLA